MTEKFIQSIFLADDDEDDCMFFRDALDELPLSVKLTTVHDGEKLMQLLKKTQENLPSALFLDLNMPFKNGFECLTEIKQNDKLKNLAVIIFSTSFQPEVINKLFNHGAQHYIRKPADFKELKSIIHRALKIIEGNFVHTSKEDFVLV